MELKEIEVLLQKSNDEIQAIVKKAEEEVRTLGATCAETKERQDKLEAENKELRKQQDEMDLKIQRKQLEDTAEVPLVEWLQKNTDVERLIKDGGKGRVMFTLAGHHAAQVLGIKTTLTADNVGSTPRTTTGVLPIERDAGITEVARRTPRFRDMLASRPTSARLIDYVKVENGIANATEQSPEGSAKHENAITFSSASEEVKTIATWMPVSSQMLSDWSELGPFLQSELRAAVMLETEEQLLYANGVGNGNLHGIVPQATAFNTALLPGAGAGTFTLIDIIGWARAQVAIANETPPTFVLLNPADWYEILLTKDSQGRYIMGDPWSQGVPNLFGLNIVPSTVIAAGEFLVGSGDPRAAEVRSKMEVTIAIGEQHSDYFTKNLVAIRAEERLCLVTKRPASFIFGSLTASPA